MNNIDKSYIDLLKDIMENGVSKGDRTGTGTVSVFGRMIRHKMSEGFPLLTTKKVHWKGIVTELLWFLKGDTDIRYLLENKNHIWVGDAYKKYKNQVLFSSNPYDRHIKSVSPGPVEGIGSFEIGDDFTKEEFVEKIKLDPEFANRWADLGPVYGKQWRKWGVKFEDEESVEYYDQISSVIDLLKNNPDSRRIMVNAWNVSEIGKMTLPPCHYSFQFWTRELDLEERFQYWFHRKKPNRDVVDHYDTVNEKTKGEYLDASGVPSREVSLLWNQRSVDTFLGLPFNIASYGLLLEIVAKYVNMVPGEIIGSLGDTHLYNNHLEQAKVQISREPMSLCTLDIHPGILDYNIENMEPDMFKIHNYKSHKKIVAELSN